MKIAVCIHLYHTNMWEEIIPYLNNLKVEYDLYVNLPIKETQFDNNLPADFIWSKYTSLNPDLIPNGVKTEPLAIRHYLKHGIKEKRKYTNNILIEDRIKKFKPNAKIISSPNKGVDIGGFLYTYKHVDPKTDLILKIHTKAGLGSTQTPSRGVLNKGIVAAKNSGNGWFKRLMDGVLLNELKVNNILNEFKHNPECGMVGFKQYNNFSTNIKEMNSIFRIFNTPNNHNNCFFVGGTVFWVRNSVLKKYLTPNNIDKILTTLPSGYVYEPSPNHAMERIFGCLVYKEKQKLIVIN
jgi:lipopolysaccharide biosynthesis protein